jgi:signal transduction histidine kinase
MPREYHGQTESSPRGLRETQLLPSEELPIRALRKRLTLSFVWISILIYLITSALALIVTASSLNASIDANVRRLIAEILPSVKVDKGELTLNNQLIIIVEDTGIGIPSESVSHVFDRFYRVEVARTREQGGTGLGLSIAKAIAEAHSGTIAVESVLGAGSKFTVVLPGKFESQRSKQVAQAEGQFNPGWSSSLLSD